MSFKSFSQYLSEQKKQGMYLEKPVSLGDEKNYIMPPDYYANSKAKVKDNGLLTADDDNVEPLSHKKTPGINNKVAHPLGEKPHVVKKVKKKKKGKLTECFLKQTKKMSDAEFVKTMLEQTETSKGKVYDIHGKTFTPEPSSTLKYFVNSLLTNENFMSKVVREIKRKGGFDLLVNEVLSHKESFDVISEAATDQKIQKKLNEAIAPSRGVQEQEGLGSVGGGGAGITGGSNNGGAGTMGNVKTGGGMGGTPSPSFEQDDSDNKNQLKLDDSPNNKDEDELKLDDKEDKEDDEFKLDDKEDEMKLDDEESEEEGDEDSEHIHIHHHGKPKDNKKKHIHIHHHHDDDENELSDNDEFDIGKESDDDEFKLNDDESDDNEFKLDDNQSDDNESDDNESDDNESDDNESDDNESDDNEFKNNKN